MDNLTKGIIGFVTDPGHKIIVQGKTACVGHRESDDEYVAWTYTIAPDNEPDFFWGHYGTLELALDQFFIKESLKKGE